MIETPSGGWTLTSLAELFASDPEELGDVDVSVTEGTDVLRVTLKEQGDLDVLVTANGEQVLMSVAITPRSDIPNAAEFDRLLLVTHKLIPLSTFGLTTIDGAEWYELFGSLSAASRASVIIEEAATLAVNAVEAAELVGEWVENGGATSKGGQA